MMTVGDGKTVEIYCAYARKQRDEELWEKLKTHLIPLEIKGDITLWYDGKVSPGSEWKPEIDTHLDTAEVILLLISPDFLASERHYEQMKRAIKRYKAREVQVIPIILYPCVLEDSPIEGLPVLPDDDCPITEWGSGEDKAFVNISKGIRRIVHELIIRKAEVASNQHLWHVPARDSHFTDREDILNNLHNAFKADPNYRNTPIRTVQALTGLAGIGKTEIAIEYAHRYREDYRHIFWMQAGTRKELIADFLKLARFLHLRGSNLLDSTSIIAAVKDWLETEKQWLLIWDGVSDFAQISDMLPLYSTGHIILTTCTQASEPNTGRVRIGRVRVDKMRPEHHRSFPFRTNHLA